MTPGPDGAEQFKMTDTIQNIALIGAGMVAQSHLLSIVDLSSKVRLAGVLASNTGSTEKAAKNASNICGYEVSAYDDIERLCADNSIDWVILITPPNARMEIVQNLAASGKGILCEKPIERNSAAAAKIVSICETHEVPLGIVFQHRAREVSIKLQKLIDEGELGQLTIAEANVPWWREQSYYDEPGRGTFERDGGGVLISQAIHTLDLLLSMTGPVSEVQAMAHTTKLHELEAEDYVTAGVRFENGAVGTIVASTASYPGDAESIVLHFTNCVARLQSGRLVLNWRNGKTEEMGEAMSTGGGADPMAFTHEWHRNIIEDFSDSFAAKRPPMATGRDGLNVHNLIDALLTSSRNRVSVVLNSKGATSLDE